MSSVRRPRDEKVWDRLEPLENAKVPLRTINVSADVLEIARVVQLSEDNEDDDGSSTASQKQRRNQLRGLKNVRTKALDMKFRQRERGSYVYGRIFGDNSILSLDKSSRNFLFHGFYELDLVNALPTILFHYFPGSHQSLKFLPSYVENREELLVKYTGDNQYLRRVLKKMIVSSLISGKWEIQEFTELTVEQKGVLSEFNFAMAVQDAKIMWDAYKGAYPEFFKLHKKSASALAVFYNDIEAHVIEACVSYMEKRYPELQKRVIPAYDAIWFKLEETEDTLVSDIALTLEEHIAQRFNGLQVNIGVSKIESEIPLTRELIPEYAEWKSRFEVSHFKLLNPIMFCKVDKEGSLQMMGRNRFVNEMCAEEYKPHVQEWMADPSSLKYSKLTFAPPPVPSEDAYNMYKGLRAEFLDRVPDSEIKQLTLRVRQQLFSLVVQTKPVMITWSITWPIEYSFQAGYQVWHWRSGPFKALARILSSIGLAKKFLEMICFINLLRLMLFLEIGLARPWSIG